MTNLAKLILSLLIAIPVIFGLTSQSGMADDNKRNRHNLKWQRLQEVVSGVQSLT